MQQAVGSSPYVAVHSFVHTCHLVYHLYSTEVVVADCSIVAYTSKVPDLYKVDLVHGIESVPDTYSLDLVPEDQRREWSEVENPAGVVRGNMLDHVPAATDYSGRCRDVVPVDHPGESGAPLIQRRYWRPHLSEAMVVDLEQRHGHCSSDATWHPSLEPEKEIFGSN